MASGGRAATGDCRRPVTANRNAELIRSGQGTQPAIRRARALTPGARYPSSSRRSTLSAYIDDFSSTGFAL